MYLNNGRRGAVHLTVLIQCHEWHCSSRSLFVSMRDGGTSEYRERVSVITKYVLEQREARGSPFDCSDSMS